MKFVITVMIVLAVLGGYLYMNPGTWREWAKDTPLESGPTITHLYKWQDANGQWHVSDKPPEGNIEYNRVEYSSDTNIIPPVPLGDD